MPKSYIIMQGYKITKNGKERTCTIYSSNGKFLSTVDDGEVEAEIERLENGKEDD